MSAPSPWLAARIRAYGAALDAPRERIEAAVAAAADVAANEDALATARARLLGVDPGVAAWTGVLAARQGLQSDPARPYVTQTLALARTPIAARAFRRRPLRRLLSRVLLRPLAALLRPAQLLTGRVAD